MRTIILSLIISFSVVSFSKAQSIQPFVVDTGVQLNPTLMEFFEDGVGFIGGYTAEEFTQFGTRYQRYTGYLYRSIDGGNSWSKVWNSRPSTTYFTTPLSIAKLNGGIYGAVLVDTTGSGFWYSFDSGGSWIKNENKLASDSTRITLEDIIMVDNKALCVGYGNVDPLQSNIGFSAVISEDLGNTWTKLYTDITDSYYFFKLDRSRSGSVFLAYDKAEWTQGPLGSSSYWTNNIVDLDLQTGNYNVVLHDTLYDLNDFDMLTDQLGFIVGYNGVHKTVDGGTTWYKEQTPFALDFIGDEIFFNEQTHDVFIIGRETEINSSRDVVLYKGAANGLTWTELFREYSDTNALYDQEKTQVFAIAPDGSAIIGMFNNRFYRIDNVVGVEEAELSEQLQVYPNPASNTINIDFAVPTTAQVKLFDLTGQQVLTKSISNLSSTTIDVSALSQGVYVLHLKQTDGSVVSQKIIVE